MRFDGVITKPLAPKAFRAAIAAASRFDVVPPCLEQVSADQGCALVVGEHAP